MCGICGFYEYKTHDRADRQVLDDMLEVIHHRGPDDSGVYSDKDVALGMRRLSIIDLSGGKQPICNEDGSIVTVFNGEIYNFRDLRRELRASKEYLQSLLEEHGRVNDDLGTANEELISSNEELQSMNEELQTAKEELQSTNEELTTVNDELQSGNRELNLVNADLINLLNTVEIPIVFLDAQRRIRRFTPQAQSIFNVLSTDVGRPIDEIKPKVDAPGLDADIAWSTWRLSTSMSTSERMAPSTLPSIVW